MSQEPRYRQFETKHERPNAWIQWKGTEVCMDVYCSCGEQFHVDAEFAYYVKCPHCGQHYECDGHVTLHPIPAEEIEATRDKICEPIEGLK